MWQNLCRLSNTHEISYSFIYCQCKQLHISAREPAVKLTISQHLNSTFMRTRQSRAAANGDIKPSVSPDTNTSQQMFKAFLWQDHIKHLAELRFIDKHWLCWILRLEEFISWLLQPKLSIPVLIQTKQVNSFKQCHFWWMMCLTYRKADSLDLMRACISESNDLKGMYSNVLRRRRWRRATAAESAGGRCAAIN